MGSRVLLADDSITIQKVVGIIFANEGYELTTVSTGDDAIAKAIETRPDVMLVDALMPGKNGYEVCREIRQNPALAHTAILLMTGAFEVVDEEKNRASGADDFITKPFESQSLIDATNRMIALTAQRASSAAAAPQVATPPEPAPVSAPAPSVDDVWATGFDMEPAADLPPEPVFETPAAAEVTPVKVTSDDDIWGAFDMDAVEISPSPVQSAPVAVDSSDDFFSFEAETPQAVELPATDEFVLEDVAVGSSAGESFPAFTGFEPVGEQEISFADASQEPPVPVQEASIPLEEDFSTISFDEPIAPPVMSTPVFEAPPPPVVEAPPLAPVFEAPPLPPVVEAAPPVAPPPVAPTPAVQAAAAAIGTFDESQVKELLASISRDVIEKIVWEVVPDLAETLIKEEIRKLKAGIA